MITCKLRSIYGIRSVLTDFVRNMGHPGSYGTACNPAVNVHLINLIK